MRIVVNERLLDKKYYDDVMGDAHIASVEYDRDLKKKKNKSYMYPTSIIFNPQSPTVIHREGVDERSYEAIALPESYNETLDTIHKNYALYDNIIVMKDDVSSLEEKFDLSDLYMNGEIILPLKNILKNMNVHINENSGERFVSSNFIFIKITGTSYIVYCPYHDGLNLGIYTYSDTEGYDLTNVYYAYEKHKDDLDLYMTAPWTHKYNTEWNNIVHMFKSATRSTDD